MKRDLRSMGNKNEMPPISQQMPPISQQEIENASQNIDPATLNNVQSVLNQYGDKSEADLMNDLKGFQQAGVMDNAALYDMAQKISPMLNIQQQQKLYVVMQELAKNEY